MAFWLDIAAFLVKALIIVAAVGGLAVLIARLARSGEAKDKEIKVKSLNERYDDMRDAMDGALLDKKERKALARARKKEDKAAAKARRGQEPGKRIYVLGFKGDMRATAVKRLGSEIDAVLIAARPGADEAVIRIESPGGTVTGYGLAAAEILRLRQHKIRVTASVDQVAASGGYMMACAADRIVAAPFAVVGSIGVVAPVPNLHRLLKKNEIEFEEMTAGEFKRTVSVLGEITPEGREHFRGKLDATHEAFKAHVQECRPNMDMAKVANGDHWLAREAIGLGLVDELMTGDELLFRARDSARLYEVSTEARKTLMQQLLGGLGVAARRAADLVFKLRGGPGWPEDAARARPAPGPSPRASVRADEGSALAELRGQCGRRKINLSGRWRSCSSANTLTTLRSTHARYTTSSILGSRAWKCRSRPCSDKTVKPQKSPKRS